MLTNWIEEYAMAKVRALVLEKQHELALREIDMPLEVGPGMVRIAPKLARCVWQSIHPGVTV